MLELRPTCEHCNTALPANAENAMICSFECTFCAVCVEMVLGNVCPNCGGGFCQRPIRPKHNWKGNNDTAHYPSSAKAKHRPVDAKVHEKFSANIKSIPPEQR